MAKTNRQTMDRKAVTNRIARSEMKDTLLQEDASDTNANTTPVTQKVTMALLAGGVSVLALTIAGRAFGTTIPAELGLLLGGMTMVGSSFFIKKALKSDLEDKLDVVARALRDARDGKPVSPLDDEDNGVFSDITRLANDLMEIQAQVGAYHSQITSSNDVLRLASETRKTLETDQVNLKQQLASMGETINELSEALEDGNRSAATTMNALDSKSSTVLGTLLEASKAIKKLTDEIKETSIDRSSGISDEHIEDLQNRLHAINAAVATVQNEITEGTAALRNDLHASDERTNTHIANHVDKQEAGHMVLETRLDSLKQAVEHSFNGLVESQNAAQSDQGALKSLMVETAAATHQMASNQETQTARLEDALTKSADATRAFIGDKITEAAEGHAQLRGEVRKTQELFNERTDELKETLGTLNTSFNEAQSDTDDALPSRMEAMIEANRRQSTSITELMHHMEIQSGVMERGFESVHHNLKQTGTELGRRIEAAADATMRAIPPISSFNSISDLLCGQSDVLNLKLDDLADRLSKISLAVDKPVTVAQVETQTITAPDPALEKIASAFAALQSSFETFATDMRTDRPVSVAASPEVKFDYNGLAEFDATKGNFQNILVAFRTLLRQISDQTAEYRDRVTEISAAEIPTSEAATPIQPAPTADHVEPLLNTLTEKVTAMQEAINRQGEAHPKQDTMKVEMPDLTELPDFSASKTSMQHVLVGFRILLRDIEGETQRLRQAVTLLDAAGASEAMPLANAQLSQSTENFETYAERFTTLFDGTEKRLSDHMDRTLANLGATLAETISETESRLAEPLSTIAHDISDSKRALDDLKAAIQNIELREEHDQIVQPAFSNGSSPSVTMAVNLMTAFSASMEARFTTLDDAVSEVSEQLQNGDEEVSETVTFLSEELQNSANAVRDQLGEFIAVGAAISEELEQSKNKENEPEKHASR